MDKRELAMFSVQDIIKDLLREVPIKTIARIRKISKNTVKRYQTLLTEILEQKPELRESIDGILQEISKCRKRERFSENFGWLETNTGLLESLATKCDNYVRLVEVLQEKGFGGSYSSLLRYLEKNRFVSEEPIVRIETKPGEIAQVDYSIF